MRCGTNRQRLDPVLGPDQFGVAKTLGPEDLDRHVTRHGIYPAFLMPTGVLWSEYVRCQMSGMHRSRSVSYSTEALDSDHARYITSRITRDAQSLATGTRYLPTDSPGPYFQPIPHERGKHLRVCLVIWICQWVHHMWVFYLAPYRVHKDPQDEPIQT